MEKKSDTILDTAPADGNDILDALCTPENELVDGNEKNGTSVSDDEVEKMAADIISDDEFDEWAKDKKDVYEPSHDGGAFAMLDDWIEPSTDPEPASADGVVSENGDGGEFENKILTERFINKLKRQQKEKEEEEQRQLNFLTWYYNYQLQQYRDSHGFEMEGRLRRQTRKKIVKQWESGKLKKLYESNLN